MVELEKRCIPGFLQSHLFKIWEHGLSTLVLLMKKVLTPRLESGHPVVLKIKKHASPTQKREHSLAAGMHHRPSSYVTQMIK